MAPGDLAKMKQTLAMARVAVGELREGVELTRQRLTRERAELETVRRRKAQAAGIADAETVRVAERFEAEHAERVAVLTRKLEAQEAELALAERDVAAMADELRAAVQGRSAPPPRPPADPLAEADRVGAELDGLERASARAAREAEAEARLAALKRRMGK